MSRARVRVYDHLDRLRSTASFVLVRCCRIAGLAPRGAGKSVDTPGDSGQGEVGRSCGSVPHASLIRRWPPPIRLFHGASPDEEGVKFL